jgi:hypothetical protein
MTNPGASKLQLLVITGNPTVDAVIRYGLVAAFMFLTGSITGWLNRAGFNDPNLDTYVGIAVATALSALALALWGIVRVSKMEVIVKIREAIGVQAGINIAESAEPTPQNVTVPMAQAIIAEHATPIEKN